MERNDAGTWLHPLRLPLGAGFNGHCSAPGHDGVRPSDDELREYCNVGYAAGCLRLPRERSCDAVRFSVARENAGQVYLRFVCEAAHLPVAHGTLQYDVMETRWIAPHSDEGVQKMAECYVQSYLAKKVPVDVDVHS
jgi:hypothetical protein